MKKIGHDEARARAQESERDNPLWIVVFGVYTQEFICLPRFRVPPCTMVIVRSLETAVPRMRLVEKLYLSPPGRDDV
jgi:hypothetical protein